MTEHARLLGERYELSDILGRGGMAEVRLGHDLRLGRTVAVKTLRSDLALDSTFQARFRKEAQSAASLNHSSVAAVYDTGEDYADGVPVPYIVMEYVEGQTLRELLNSGRKLLPERALEITVGVLQALDYSHHNGIVHRDIKPGNVMLTRSGNVKVMDFGIARAVADSTATMTATAAVIGTAQYLSPEQAKGEKVDARSDLYSTGCLLYELLTGRPPFTGDSPVSVAYQHVREQPRPPSQIDSQVSDAMDAIVLKSLAKNADNRYQDAHEMREDIERCLEGRPVTAPAVLAEAHTERLTATGAAGAAGAQPPPGGPSRRGRRARRSAGLVLLAITVLAVVVLGALIGRSVLGDTGQRVSVPSLVGLTQDVAENRLEAKGLGRGVVGFEPSDRFGEGRVIRQSPEGETAVDQGVTVDLVVSTGEVAAEVPDVVGLALTDARQKLRDAGLEPDEVTRRNSERPDSEVLSVRPDVGTELAPGSIVDLVVSNGTPLVEVPDVVGRPYQTAFAILSQAGFKVPRPQSRISDEVAPNAVLNQVPAAGSKIPRGDNVSLVVAQQPQPEPQPQPQPEPQPTPEPSAQPPTPTPTPSSSSPPAGGLLNPGGGNQPGAGNPGGGNQPGGNQPGAGNPGGGNQPSAGDQAAGDPGSANQGAADPSGGSPEG